MYQQVSLVLTHGAYIGSLRLTIPLNPSPLAAIPAGRSWHIVPAASHPAITRNACVGRVQMAEHPVESASLRHVSTAKQATFQVAPRRIGQRTLRPENST